MNSESAAKEKVDLDVKYILKLTLTLLITCVVVAGVLGYVNSITKDRIAEFTKEKTETAMKAVVTDPDNSKFKDVKLTDKMTKAAADYSVTLDAVSAVTTSGSDAGYAVKVTSSGSQGDIVMMVGIDADGAVTGVSIVSNVETSGIGSKVMSNTALANGTGVLDQFKGKTAQDQPLKVGKNVDAISGATVSSKGVTRGVNAALAAATAIG